MHASATCLQAQVRSWLAHRGLQHRVAAAVRMQAHARARLSRQLRVSSWHLLSPRLLVHSIARSRRLAAAHTARALEQFDTSNLHGATQAAVNEAAALFLDAIAAHSRAPRAAPPLSCPFHSRWRSHSPRALGALTLPNGEGGTAYGGAHVEHGGEQTTRYSSTCASTAAHGSSAPLAAHSTGSPAALAAHAAGSPAAHAAGLPAPLAAHTAAL